MRFKNAMGFEGRFYNVPDMQIDVPFKIYNNWHQHNAIFQCPQCVVLFIFIDLF